MNSKHLKSELDDGDFLAWIHDNAERLGLVIAVHNEFLDIWPNVVAARSFLIFRGRRIEGIGYGSTEAHAVIVSVSELIERCCMLGNSLAALSSSGFAVHTNKAIAERSAIFELLERDSYLCHHYTGTAFLAVQITKDLLIAAPTLACLLQISKKNMFTIRLGIMNAIGGGHARIVILNGTEFTPSFGVIIASAYDLDPFHAVERCCRELMATLAFRLNTNLWEGVNLSQFSLIPSPGPQDHGRYSLYPDKAIWFGNAFAETIPNTPRQAQPPVIKIQQLQIPSELGAAPIHAVRAHSSNLQELFFGSATRETINLKRLSDFAGRPIILEEVLSYGPHFLD